MIYFTSDWHIGHNKPFIYEKRGFNSIEEHDTTILQRCNKIVCNPDDELWILGDLCMGGDVKEWNRIYNNLICKNVHYLQGNHETDYKMDIYDRDYKFEFHGFADMMKIGKKMNFFLSHYPTMVGNHEDKKPIWNLSGHTHSKDKFENGLNKIYNVSVDAHNCYPISIDHILKDITRYTNIQR